MRNYINKSSIKSFILPFNGFYQGHIEDELQTQIEEHISYLSDEQSRFNLEEWLETSDIYYAYKSFYNVVSSQLVEFMQDKINDYYNTSLCFYNIDYQKMTMQNTGDNIYASIEVKNIPSLELISGYTGLTIDELFNELQLLSDNKLKSCSGFSSFYNHDLAPLKGIDLLYWNDAYISLIIDFLINDFFGGANDLELAYLEDSYSYGGMLDIFLNCLSNDDLKTFNSFT